MDDNILNMNTDYDEIEIDLIALLWRMASHWKPVLLLGILCGVLFLVYSYHADAVKYKDYLRDIEEMSREEEPVESEDNDNDSTDTPAQEPQQAEAVPSEAAGSKTVQELIDERIKEKEKAALDEGAVFELNENTDSKDEEMSLEQKEAVEALVDKQLRYEEYSKYIDNSPLMGIDPYSEKTLTVTYRLFTASDRILDESAAELMANLLSDQGIKSFSEELKTGIEPRYLRELYSVAYTPVNSQISKNDFLHEGIIELKFMLSDGISESLCADSIKKLFESYAAKSNDLDFEFVGKYTRVSIDNSLLDKQNTFISTNRDHETEIKTALSAFGDMQLDYYRELVSKSKGDLSPYEKEKAYRDGLSEKIEAAKSSAEEAMVAASEAKASAENSAVSAAKAEEQSELKAKEAEEAAKEALKARAAEKQAKAKAAEARRLQSAEEASDSALLAEGESENAARAAAKAKAAAEIAEEMALAADEAANNVDTAVELRESAREASRIASEASEEADAKAAEALAAYQAASEAVDIANASELSAQAQAASEEAQLAATEAEAAEEAAVSDMDEDETEPAEDEAAVEAPSLNPSRLLLGMIFGMFLYGGAVFAYIILRPRVCLETCSALLSDRRTMWIREYREPGTLFERFIGDVFIYRLTHKGIPALGVQLERAAASLKFFADKDGIDFIVLLSTSDRAENNARIEASLLDKATGNLPDIKALTVRYTDADYYEQVRKLSDVVLVSEYGITDVNNLNKTLSDLREYGIRCIGHLVLGE